MRRRRLPRPRPVDTWDVIGLLLGVVAVGLWAASWQLVLAVGLILAVWGAVGFVLVAGLCSSPRPSDRR